MKIYTFLTLFIVLYATAVFGQCSISIASTTNVDCNGASTGAITAVGAGGTSPYNYSWSGGQTTSTIIGLPAGNYCVTVQDANNCTATTCVTITEPAIPLTVDAYPTSNYNGYNISCFGVNDGEAVAVGSGGTGVINYIWPTGSTGSVATGLLASYYCVTATDANGCSATDCITNTQPSMITITVTNSTNVSCFGYSDGTATISASGGIGGYTYLWNNGFTGNHATGLAPGLYAITVEDAAGCSMNITGINHITITEPPALNLSLSGPDTICIGTTGTITGMVTGGTPVYSYIWNTLTALPAVVANQTATYCLTVTDINGCTISDCRHLVAEDFEVNFNPNNTLYNSLYQAFGVTTSGQPYSIQTQTTAPGTTIYSWTPSSGLSSTTSANPMAAPTVSTAYYLQSANASTGCTDLDTIIVYLHEKNISHIEISPDSIASYCTDIPMMMSGGTSTAAASSTSNYGSLSSPSFGCFEYTSNGTTPEVVDTIVWVNCDQYYSPIAFTYVPICDTNIIYITTASCVWPGDADNDGIANNMDLLPIGLHHGATGTTRYNATNNYTCQPSRNWNIGTTGNPTVDIKHIDSDGNGTINDLDTNAIVLNWSQTHIKTINTTTTGIELYIDTATTTPGDTLILPIILGDAQNPTAGYGIAFTINYDVNGIDTNSVSIDYNSSWLGTIGNNMIGISKDFYNAGQVQVAMTRTDHNSIMGGGSIGHIRFTIKDDVLPKSAFVRLDFEITDIRFIDHLGDTITTIGVPSQILVVDGPVGNSTIENTKNEIHVFPNPTGNLLNIQSWNEEIEMIQIIDMTGKLLLEQTNIQNLQTSLNMNTLPSGIYILNIQTSSQMQQVRVLKN